MSVLDDTTSWLRIALETLQEAVESGAQELHAELVYTARPDFPRDPRFRRRVMSDAFCCLRDAGMIARVSARIVSRDTGNPGYVTIWRATERFDSGAVNPRAAGQAITCGADNGGQGWLPFSEPEGAR